MEQEARLDFLLAHLCDEYSESISIPNGYAQKRTLLRALVNVRPPHPVAQAFLRIQDEFLQEEAKRRGIVRLADIPPSATDARISVWQGDITRLQVDAIVNAANSALLGCFVPEHHCIDNAIHTHAGVQLRQACHELMLRQGYDEPTGTAKITPAYNLPCRYVLHTVGPIVRGELTPIHMEQLANCYNACLMAAREYEVESIAFCCISTGVFGFPQQEAAQIALRTVKRVLSLDDKIKRVVFNVFLDRDYELYTKLIQ